MTFEPARQLLQEYLSGTDPTWFGGEAREDRRVDAFLVPSLSKTTTYYVASLQIDDCFVPDFVSEHPHIPYDIVGVNAKSPRDTEPGVFVTATRVHSPAATEARFTHRGTVRTAPVTGGHCALFDWDTGWLQGADVPKPAALLIGDAWIPTVSSFVAATPEDFRRAYATRDDAGGRFNWAVMSFLEYGTFAEKLHMVESILDDPTLSDTCLNALAAGPVEDLLGHKLLDHVTQNAKNRSRWVPLLRDTYWDSTPSDVRERLRALLEPRAPTLLPKRR